MRGNQQIGRICLILVISAVCALNAQRVFPVYAQTGTPYPQVTPQDLINAINALRTAVGHKALIVDPILMYTAQETADYMAVNQMNGPIGNVRDRIIAAGYGAGDIPWATENFALGPATVQEIMQIWSDDEHMKPVNNQYYRHIGAGVAEFDGTVYYIVHAAYTSNRIYQPASGTLTPRPTFDAVAQVIYPVRVATAQPDGKIIHLVKQGQTLWTISAAYGVSIEAIIAENHLLKSDPTIYIGQKLTIPRKAALQAVDFVTQASPSAAPFTVTVQAAVPATKTPPPKPTMPASKPRTGNDDPVFIFSLVLIFSLGTLYVIRSVKSK